MIKSNFAICILAFAIFINCKSDLKETKIIINLESTRNNKMDVFNIVEDLVFDLSGVQDSIILDLDTEVILDLYQGRYHSYIHVKPGDQLYIDTISSIPITLGVQANPSTENKYLDSFWRLEQESSYSYMIPELAQLPIDSFKLKVEEKNRALEELISKINKDKKVSIDFKQAMTNRYIAVKSNDLSFYRDFYHHRHNDFPKIPTDYYESFESVELVDPSFLIFEEGRQIVSNYHARNLDFDNYDSLLDFYKAKINSANKSYVNPEVAKYCSYDLIAEMISFGGGLDDAFETINNFKVDHTKQYYKLSFEKLIAPWRGIVKGAPAPDFVATTLDGTSVKLSDLKGKKVYIDIWATWCGPCIAEIPALKKLEKELSDENINFVSISIDESKDIEKWKTFVTQKELTGIQLIADGAWKSDIATAYNVKGIPRFLLIDEKGKILSATAPRPSSENVKEILLN